MNACRQRIGKPRLAALCGLAMLLAGAAPATQGLPRAVVLVLKVLSSTHARPVTGVVLTGDGQLVVPADFVARGDAIVVLAGGTDMERDATPTRTVARSAELGLAVLAAEGLDRPAAPVSDDPPRNGEPLRFAAFPPAEQLAAGQAPIVEMVALSLESGHAAIADATPLPNLSGALFDACGYLAGLVLAAGEPGLQRDAKPRVVLRDELKAALRQLEVPLTVRACRAVAAPPGAVTDTAAAAPVSGPQILDPGSLLPTGPDLAVGAAEPAPAGGAAAPAADPGTADPAAGAAPPPAAGAPADQRHDEAASGAAGDRPGSSLGWGAVAVLSALAALAGWWLGARTRVRAPAPIHSTVPAPATADSVPEPRGQAPQGRLLLTAQVRYPDGRTEAHAVPLDPAGPGCLIGRGQADLIIDDERLGRLHGRLEAPSGRLLYCDLGSRWGSWVEGVACLEGERFFLPAAAELQLGEVRLRLTPAADAPAGP